MEKGIDELKDAIEFLLMFVTAGDEELADGFQARDIFRLLSLIPKGVAAFEGYREIPGELNDLDDEEAAEIKVLFEKFELRDDDVEKVVETVLQELVTLFGSYGRIRDAVKGARKEAA